MPVKGYWQLLATFKVECFHTLHNATHLKCQYDNFDLSICFYWLLTFFHECASVNTIINKLSSFLKLHSEKNI